MTVYLQVNALYCWPLLCISEPCPSNALFFPFWIQPVAHTLYPMGTAVSSCLTRELCFSVWMMMFSRDWISWFHFCHGPLATAIYTQTCLLQSWGLVPLLSSYQHICPSGKLGSMCLSEMSLKIFFMAGYRAIYSSMDTSAYCSCRGPKFTHFGWLMATCTNTYRFDSLFGPHKYL